MPIIINDQLNMPEVTGAVYPNSTTALAWSPIHTFDGGTATSTGVFPDQALAGSQIANAYHVHQIEFAGVITRICVTFLDTSKTDQHVAWMFYWPDAARASTFNRMTKRNYDQAMLTAADDVFQRFIDGCPTTPAITANTAIIERINRNAQLAAQEAVLETARREQAVPVSASAKDRALFSAPSTTLGAERTDSEVADILKNCTVTIDAKDMNMVRIALKRNLAKTDWNRLINPYYDSLLPASPSSSV